MKRLSELTKYVLSIKYIEGEACPDMEEINDGCEHPYSYLEHCDVEELVSELDDAFEHCKMDLESTKATVEELQIKIEKANQLIRKMSDVAQIDVDLNTYDIIY